MINQVKGLRNKARIFERIKNIDKNIRQANLQKRSTITYILD